MIFNRESARKYYVGLDLGEKVSQLSYIAPLAQGAEGIDPVTFAVRRSDIRDPFNIPTQLCKQTGSNLWFCGDEAALRAGRGEGVLIRHLLSGAVRGEPVMIEGQGYDPASLLALFVRRSLALMASVVPVDRIAVLTLSVSTPRQDVIEALRRVRDFLAIPELKVQIESHAASLYHYLELQPEAMHERDVLVCEWDGRTAMRTTRMRYNYRTSPVVAYVERASVAQGFAGPGEDAEGEAGVRNAEQRITADIRDESFLALLKEKAPEGEISTIFLLGEGFQERWMRSSLEYAAYHRRVFLGSNLYSRGAAISAYLLAEEKTPRQTFFLDETGLSYNIGIMLTKSGASAYQALLDAGIPWYEVRRELDLIVDDEPVIHLVLTPLAQGAVREEHITLDGLPIRPAKTTRIRLELSMRSETSLILTVRDLGFGEISPATDLVWEEEIDLGRESGEEGGEN